MKTSLMVYGTTVFTTFFDNISHSLVNFIFSLLLFPIPNKKRKNILDSCLRATQYYITCNCDIMPRPMVFCFPNQHAIAMDRRSMFCQSDKVTCQHQSCVSQVRIGLMMVWLLVYYTHMFIKSYSEYSNHLIYSLRISLAFIIFSGNTMLSIKATV